MEKEGRKTDNTGKATLAAGSYDSLQFPQEELIRKGGLIWATV